jgi:hypothetical protein
MNHAKMFKDKCRQFYKLFIISCRMSFGFIKPQLGFIYSAVVYVSKFAEIA